MMFAAGMSQGAPIEATPRTTKATCEKGARRSTQALQTAHWMVNMVGITEDRRKLVLYVDDEPSLLELGQLFLERGGYRFVGGLGGRDGLRLAHELHPDLVLLDYMMPGMSGKEVFEELRQSADERLRHTPVIMLTARSHNQTEQRELLEEGLAAYLCKPFGSSELLNVIGNVLATSEIKERNYALEEEARQSFIATVRALVSLLNIKDNYTGEHSIMTAELAEAIALKLDLPETQVMEIKLGALLHDIGKIGVPEAILLKPARLTPQEQAVMRCHVNHGVHVLEGVPLALVARTIVKHHHERWDGEGYPDGLQGQGIPLGARIVAVADAYDAMTSDRPYRLHLPQSTAVARLRAAAGTQFDPQVVDGFLASLKGRDAARPPTLDLGFLTGLEKARRRAAS